MPARFIWLTSTSERYPGPCLVNIGMIQFIRAHGEGSALYLVGDDLLHVLESPAQLLALIAAPPLPSSPG
jgi:hypothetical protein